MNSLFRIVVVIALAIMALAGIYAFLFWNSLRKIDAFCNSIGTSTKMNELPALADRAGVDLRGPVEMSGSFGTYAFAIAASGFTIGEYSCRVRGTGIAGNVSSRSFGY